MKSPLLWKRYEIKEIKVIFSLKEKGELASDFRDRYNNG